MASRRATRSRAMPFQKSGTWCMALRLNTNSRRRATVLVGEVAAVHDLDVVEAAGCHLAMEHVDHRRRHVDGDDATAVRGDGDCKHTGPGTEVDHGRVAIEAVLAKDVDIGRRVVLRLRFVSRDVRLVEVLLPGVRQLVQHPVGHAASVHDRSARLVRCSTGCCRRRLGGRSDHRRRRSMTSTPSRPTPCVARWRGGSPSSRLDGSPLAAPSLHSARPRWPCRSGLAASHSGRPASSGRSPTAPGWWPQPSGGPPTGGRSGSTPSRPSRSTDDVRDAVTTPVERAALSDPLDATVVFCAKEAFYKCWSVLDGAVLEFTDVEVAFNVSRASPRASEPIGSAGSFVATPAGGDPWPGRWAVRDGFVVTAAWWAAGTPGGSGTTKSAAWRSPYRALTR